jgi:hypothetical protein
MKTNTISRTLVLVLALGGAAPALTGVAHAETATAAAVRPDLDKVAQHLRDHQTFPANRAQLLAACKGLIDFSAGEKRWFADHLPEGTYKSPDDVLKAIGRK